MTRIESLIAAAVVLGLSFLGGRSCAPDRPAGPPTVLVDTLYMEAERPDLVKPSLGERLTTAVAKPTQTRIALAPSAAGRLAVVTYCAPVVKVQTSAVDTAITPASRFPILLPDFAGRIRGSRVTLYSTLNDGRRWAADYRPRGHWSFETDGDSVVMRSDRLWVRVTRGAWKCAPAIGGSGAIGALTTEQPLRGALLGGVAAAIGCLF